MLKQLHFVLFVTCMLTNTVFAEVLRDPTKPLFTKPTAQPIDQETGQSLTKDAENLVLTSVLYSRQRRNATINGHILEVNDKIGNYTIVDIVEINQNFSVILEGPQGKITLALRRESVKTPVK